MAGYIFWDQVAQMQFLGPRPQNQDNFLKVHNLIGLI